MENASKALLIAGAILIAILLLTLFTYLNMKMASSTKGIYGILNESEIAEFNQQFLNYEGRGITQIGTKLDGKAIYNPLTVQDVATLINLAQDCNKNKKFPTTISVWFNGTDIAQSENYIKWLQENQIKESSMYYKPLYDCTNVKIDSETLLVTSVTLKRHTN